MTPIPPSAMPVVEILRRDVKRPEKLPAMNDGLLAWQFHSPKLDDSTVFNLYPGHFINVWALPTEAFHAFNTWWKSLTEADAAEAMDAIWPQC